MRLPVRESPALFLAFLVFVPSLALAQRYVGADGKLRIALAKQPFAPNRQSPGPDTMAGGGLIEKLEAMGAVVRVSKAALTEEEDTEYGGWKRLGMALGHYRETIAQNEKDGYFSVGLYATDLFDQLDRLHRTTDKLYVHIDMDVLDPKEVEFHGNAVPGGRLERGAITPSISASISFHRALLSLEALAAELNLRGVR